MTTKKDTRFSLEDCSCMEMMSQPKHQHRIDEAFAEMMSQFADPQAGGGECFEMMSEMMAACCGTEQEDDKIIKEV